MPTATEKGAKFAILKQRRKFGAAGRTVEFLCVDLVRLNGKINVSS
jgi:hypothetical protein